MAIFKFLSTFRHNRTNSVIRIRPRTTALLCKNNFSRFLKSVILGQAKGMNILLSFSKTSNLPGVRGQED